MVIALLVFYGTTNKCIIKETAPAKLPNPATCNQIYQALLRSGPEFKSNYNLYGNIIYSGVYYPHQYLENLDNPK